MTSRNTSVDIGKLIAAIFVIGIHTRPLSGVSSLFDFALTDILFRTAVPFFAVCTGYFLAKRTLIGEMSINRTVVNNMAVHVFFLYLAWSLFYLIVLSFSWRKSGIMSLDSYVGWFKSFLLGNSFYHLWYLAQLFWAILFFYPIVKYLSRGLQIVLISVLWLMGTFLYVYSDIIGIEHPFIHYFEYFGALTGSLVRMLPLLLTGALIAQTPSLDKKRQEIGTVFFFILIVNEALLLKSAGAERFSYIVCTLPLAYCLFCLIKNSSFKSRWDTRIISKASMNIYMIHPAVIILFGLIHIESPLLLFTMTSIVSCLLCFSYELLKKYLSTSC